MRTKKHTQESFVGHIEKKKYIELGSHHRHLVGREVWLEATAQGAANAELLGTDEGLQHHSV